MGNANARILKKIGPSVKDLTFFDLNMLHLLFRAAKAVGRWKFKRYIINNISLSQL